jgi:hypothetical protein
MAASPTKPPDFLEHLHHEIFSSEQGQLLWGE